MDSVPVRFFTTSSFTLTQTAGASGSISITGISASGAISLALGSGNGSGNFTNSTTRQIVHLVLPEASIVM